MVITIETIHYIISSFSFASFPYTPNNMGSATLVLHIYRYRYSTSCPVTPAIFIYHIHFIYLLLFWCSLLSSTIISISPLTNFESSLIQCPNRINLFSLIFLTIDGTFTNPNEFISYSIISIITHIYLSILVFTKLIFCFMFLCNV